MVAVGVVVGFELFVDADEGVDHFDGLLPVHIVIVDTVADQVVVALESIGKINGRVIFISVGIFRGGAHVPLGIGAVVPFPVGNRRYGHGHFEYIGAFENTGGAQVTAETPAPDAYAGRVDVRQRA